MKDDTKRLLKKNTLNQSEKYKLIEFLKANIARCNNKTSEDIAKFCNKEIKFPREDGKQIKIVAIHVDNVYQILSDCGELYWKKKEILKTFSKSTWTWKNISELNAKVEELKTKNTNFRAFYKIEFAGLCKRVSDIEIRLDPIGEENTDKRKEWEANLDGKSDSLKIVKKVLSGS